MQQGKQYGYIDKHIQPELHLQPLVLKAKPEGRSKDSFRAN